jgi:thioredoxin reductase
MNHPFSLRTQPVPTNVRGGTTVQALAAQVPSECHIRAQAVRIEEGDNGSLVVTLDNGTQMCGRALIYAAGVRSRQLYIPGEKRFYGKGISYSVTSHAAFCEGQAVAIVGNHRRAQVAVLTLARVARSVLFIVPHGSSPTTLSESFMQHLACYPNVTVLKGWELTAIEGDAYVQRLQFHNADGNSRRIPVDALFVELQLLPNTELVADLVARDEAGYIQVNQRCATSHPGIFAAGDATNVHSEQVPVAVGEGIKAALSVSELIGFASPQVLLMATMP